MCAQHASHPYNRAFPISSSLFAASTLTPNSTPMSSSPTPADQLQVKLVTQSTDSCVVNQRKVHKQYQPTDLVELAKSIQSSHEFVQSNAVSKLSVIAEQMAALENQAKQIIEKARLDAELHNIPCNLQKIPGKMYHLWQKPSGERFFSMLSPEEWTTSKNEHLGSFRFEYDRSWTAEKDFDTVKFHRGLVEKFCTSRAIQN
uniref:DUF2452 domain-containing protein n=1 Tax=Panagrellus redivivus TaxID=6233 RepID=A0A7E4VPN1_PANRE